MKEYEIIDFMHLKRECIGFTVDRPKGTGDYIFIHFINPVDIVLGGRTIRTAPDACIIYPPKTRHYYIAKSHEMFHNYVHFLPLNEESNPLIVGLPLNKLFYTDFGNQITKHMETIQWIMNIKKDKNDMSLVMGEMFDMLSNELLGRNKSSLYSGNALFEDLRSLVYRAPQNWDVASMASYVHLSRSRFSTKYKQIYNISPIEDVGNAKLRMAEKLLTTTTMSISNIAFECGYENVPFFIQKFKTYSGFTPGVFRENYADEQILSGGQNDE